MSLASIETSRNVTLNGSSSGAVKAGATSLVSSFETACWSSVSSLPGNLRFTKRSNGSHRFRLQALAYAAVPHIFRALVAFSSLTDRDINRSGQCWLFFSSLRLWSSILLFESTRAASFITITKSHRGPSQISAKWLPQRGAIGHRMIRGILSRAHCPLGKGRPMKWIFASLKISLSPWFVPTRRDLRDALGLLSRPAELRVADRGKLHHTR